MKFSTRRILVHSLFGASVLAGPIISLPIGNKRRYNPLVDAANLEGGVNIDALLRHANALESFAKAGPGFNRAAGTIGHNLTVEYIASTLGATGYYNVETHDFSFAYYEGNATFSAPGLTLTATDFIYSPASQGTIVADLAKVLNFGCEAADFTPDVTGKLALISRGSCELGLKVAYAGAAGAVGAIIYNNAPGPIGAATLVKPSRPEGPYVPAASISSENAAALLGAMAGGPVSGSLLVNSLIEVRYTANVIATTVGGDQNNVILSGGHTDSGTKGPGVNGGGSGTIANLEIALMLTQYSVTNAVRFCFWSAEEVGLTGSLLYVNSTSEEDLKKIALYLNFDMIASPNPGYFVFDGDSSTFNQTMPPGSDKIERVFQDYYQLNGITPAPPKFGGRSDYVGFSQAGVPVGGIFSGAGKLMTDTEAALWGGKAGEPYDPNFQSATDVVANLGQDAFVKNTKAAAHAIATFAVSTDGLLTKRGVRPDSRSRDIARDGSSLARRVLGKRAPAIR